MDASPHMIVHGGEPRDDVVFPDAIFSIISLFYRNSGALPSFRAKQLIIVTIISPFKGKLIQAHDESRLNPKTAWVHYRWVQTGTRLRIQT